MPRRLSVPSVAIGDSGLQRVAVMRQTWMHEDRQQSLAARPADVRSRARLLRGVLVEEHRLDIHGSATHVLEAGQGPPVVLLHGGIQCGGVYWGRVVSRLAESHRVLVPDVPGLGESQPMPRLDATAFADWLGTFLRLTCARPPMLVAHSLNGSLAARFAARHGHLLGGLVLSGTPGIGPYRLPPGLLFASIRSSLRPTEHNFERLLPWPFLDPDRVRALDPEWFAAFSAYLRSRSAVPSVRRTMRTLIRAGTKQVPDAELAAITAPTTLLWGRQDRMAPLRLAESAHARFGWPLHVIEDAGHVPFIEQPDAYLGTLAAVTAPL
jgi:pimeloyl-ACP methyl ester carboxylesterase